MFLRIRGPNILMTVIISYRRVLLALTQIYLSRSQISMSAIRPNLLLHAIRSVSIFLEVTTAPVRKDLSL